MRATGSILSVWILAFMVGACGDNHAGPDAGPQCSDGVDNDGDGMTDYPDDLGCENAEDGSEDSAAMPQCSDGRDNDGDGKIDFPQDPGCVAAQQNDEMDDCPDGPGCPECSNGRDDDGNASQDYPNDPGCSSASDTEEFVANPVACGSSLMIVPLPPSNVATGMLAATSTSPFAPSCGGVSGAQGIAYYFHLSTPRVVVASTENSIADTVLSIRGVNCSADGAELACNDNFTTATYSKATVSLLAGNYYIIVQGKTAATTGAYSLTVQTFGGEGEDCTDTTECGPTLVCRIPLGGTTMQCLKPVCGDGVDDDGDGKNDFPQDPGCTGLDDNDETDDCPSGPNCPACANGTDDDGDSMIDYPADTSCTTASGNSESCNMEMDPIVPISMGATMGTTVGAHDDHDPSCGSTGGIDRIYTLNLPSMQTVTFNTEGSSFDTLLSILTATCAEPSVECDDDDGVSSGASSITRTNLPGGTYLIAVDAYDDGEIPGPFNLNISGTIAPGGACEAANTLGGALMCPAAFPCEGTPGQMKCRQAQCSDGINNDADTKTDYPNDPGCTGPFDNDETDTCPGAGCPECADGLDNDADGQLDFPLDMTCGSASGQSESCQTTDGVSVITGPVTSGTTVGANNDVSPSCGSSTNTAPDKTYRLRVPALTALNLNLTFPGTSFDSATALFNSTCGGASLACSDPANMSVGALAAGTYYFVVDGWGSGSGAFNINVSGTIAPGGSCEAADTLGGALTCLTGFPCEGTPGQMKCRASLCNDGIDNDGDGKVDYPNDPGCDSTLDATENDTCPGAGCPECADGIDNDGDTKTDYPMDLTCVSASGASESCMAAEGVSQITQAVTSGTTVGATNDVHLSCASTTNTAPDRTYKLTIPAVNALNLNLTFPGTSFDSATALFDSTCAGASLSCSDPASMSVGALAAGTYFFVVDGWSSGSGAYNINLSGTLAPGSSCEPANTFGGALVCPASAPCGGTPGSQICIPPQCANGIDDNGDGKIDFPNDPGCTSPNDAVEDLVTCPGATCPACSNTVDDDADALIDYPMDFGCSSAGGTSEVFCAADVDYAGAITMPLTMGTLATAAANVTQSCQAMTGNDATYSLQLPVPVQSLVITTEGSTISDTILSLKDANCMSEVACDDDAGTGFLSNITTANVPAGNYAITVDGYQTANNGAYALNVHGTVAAGRACTSPLFTTGVLSCVTGTTCTAGTCQ